MSTIQTNYLKMKLKYIIKQRGGANGTSDESTTLIMGSRESYETHHLYHSHISEDDYDEALFEYMLESCLDTRYWTIPIQNYQKALKWAKKNGKKQLFDKYFTTESYDNIVRTQLTVYVSQIEGIVDRIKKFAREENPTYMEQIQQVMSDYNELSRSNTHLQIGQIDLLKDFGISQDIRESWNKARARLVHYQNMLKLEKSNTITLTDKFLNNYPRDRALTEDEAKQFFQEFDEVITTNALLLRWGRYLIHKEIQYPQNKKTELSKYVKLKTGVRLFDLQPPRGLSWGDIKRMSPDARKNVPVKLMKNTSFTSIFGGGPIKNVPYGTEVGLCSEPFMRSLFGPFHSRDGDSPTLEDYEVYIHVRALRKSSHDRGCSCGRCGVEYGTPERGVCSCNNTD